MPDDKGRRTTGAIPIASEQPARRPTSSFFVTEGGSSRPDLQPREPRMDVSVPVKVRYESILDFHETQSVNISRSGMFLSCADPRPVGTIIDFELALADGLSLLRGKGEVVRVTGTPTAGMGVGDGSQATAVALRGFVRAGGNLVATFTASLHDEKGRVRRDFALGDVFGVKAAGHITHYPNFNYFVPRSGAKALFDRTEIPMFPAPELAVDIRTRPGTRVLADFLKPLAGRYVPLTGRGFPAIVLNRYGRGRCLYLAGAFG